MLPVTSPPAHSGGFIFLCLFCRQVSHSSGCPWAHFIAKDNLKLLTLLLLPHLSDGFVSDSSELYKDFPGDFAPFLGCLLISQSGVLPLCSTFFQLNYKSYFMNTVFSFFWIISLGEVPRSRISGSKGMDVFCTSLTSPLAFPLGWAHITLLQSCSGWLTSTAVSAALVGF